MYDSHIYCQDYYSIKGIIADVINNNVDVEKDGIDIEKLEERIYELYNDGLMQATQYDDLMRNLDLIR